MTTIQTALELQRDWARRETYDELMSILREHAGAYGMGVDYVYTMVHGSEERVQHGDTLEPLPVS